MYENINLDNFLSHEFQSTSTNESFFSIKKEDLEHKLNELFEKYGKVLAEKLDEYNEEHWQGITINREFILNFHKEST